MPPKTSLLVRADEIKLEQILVNLLRNAIDAIQSNQHQAHTANKQGCIEIGLSAENSKALITISDNGCGIEPQNLSKLFDPFFTTKPAGEGMGLGLSVSYGIVEEFGGRLEVESILDEGTTFSVMLSLSKLETKNDQQ
jgi:C4-dicarboxylate-specific signal transduction histidine kinase